MFGKLCNSMVDMIIKVEQRLLAAPVSAMGNFEADIFRIMAGTHVALADHLAASYLKQRFPCGLRVVKLDQLRVCFAVFIRPLSTNSVSESRFRNRTAEASEYEKSASTIV